MSNVNENWGSNKGLNDIHSLLGQTHEALKFVKEWTDICKRLNPTPSNIDRQNACLTKIEEYIRIKAR